MLYMTKHWIGYHNVNKTKMSYRALPESVLYTNANGNPHAGDIVWVIEGVGNKSPKLYRLVDCFIVETMDTVIPLQFKGMKKRIIAKRSLMLPNLPINIEDLADKKLLEPLKQYLNTSPGMTGTTDKLPALEILLKMSSSTLD
ncbi:hypothetical protein C3420_05685 [Acinetobacter sp. ACNIH3]|nr:hypothetical protein C3420_05685 [Acinetobacter sp. ACNIH3]POV79560.1 hypothetical protein C3421_02955 [Acinetobacter sp. ACNIH4]